MGQIQSLAEFLSMVRRRRLMIVVISLAFLLSAMLVARFQAPVYEAAAVIQIETPTIEDTTDRGSAIGSAAAHRVQMIEQRLMARENLAAIIDRHRLYENLTGLTENDKVALLRQSVRIQSITAAQQGFGSPPVTALIIWAQLPFPDQAAAVANDLARSVLDQSASVQADRTRQTLEFFQREEARVGVEIAAFEAQITAFKNLNVDALPDALTDLRLELGGLQTALRDQEQRLLEMEREREALARNTPIRPIAQHRIEEISDQIAGLRAQSAALDARRTELEGAIARGPAVETELNTFTRREQQLQDRYSVITRRLAEAETSQRLEANQQAGRFEMLEPAMLPEHPVASSARKITAVGAAAGFAVAFGLAFLLEMLHPVLRTSERMVRQLELRPVIAIPQLENDSDRRRRMRIRLGSMILLAAALLVAMGVASALPLAV